MSDFWDEPVKPGPRFGPIFVASRETDCESCEDLIVPGQDARADGQGCWIHADAQCEKVARDDQ